ncbi:MAG: lactate utilization protein [Ruminococcaceae bacterium]|nr:lactate utilization protein [Oscillospiraceae bacterium]
MDTPVKNYYAKRAQILVKNLKSRHFDACYCETKEEALQEALKLIPEGATVSWGGSETAKQIGLIDAVKTGNYQPIDRLTGEEAMRKSITADVFLTSANAISMDGQMVNIDGLGNRVAAIIYGPKSVIVVAGMNKVEDTLEAAITRARTVAAPMNKQRFEVKTPCDTTGTCADCKAEGCICNHIVVTRHGRPVGRIKFILVGEPLGF